MECRRCPTCGETKPISDFPGKTNSYCKPCFNAYNRAWRKANPERHKAAKKKHVQGNPTYNRQRALGRYKLNIERFEALLAAQGGRCAICLTDEPRGRGWHVDHDHGCCPRIGRSCGRCIRGILCTHCNLMLGNAQDDPERLRAALRYLGDQHGVRQEEVG